MISFFALSAHTALRVIFSMCIFFSFRKNNDFKSLAELDGPLAYKVYRSTGLSSDQMDTFASINNLEFHPQKVTRFLYKFY